MINQEICAVIGMIFMAASYGVYIVSIFKGETKPHPFSWFVWGLVTAIAFFAQIADGGGIGTVITATSAIICLLISFIGYIKRKNIVISRSDKWAFGLSLLAIPLWLITDTPLWSVILITLIDTLGFYPTYRKTWYNPEQESALSYVLGGGKHFFTILALENISVITALFPFSLILTNFGLIALMVLRGKILRNAQ